MHPSPNPNHKNQKSRVVTAAQIDYYMTTFEIYTLPQFALFCLYRHIFTDNVYNNFITRKPRRIGQITAIRDRR